MKDKVLKLKSGLNMGYMEYGSDDGIPFFIFHGTPGSRKAFSQEYESIFKKHGYRVIVPSD